MSEFEEVFQDSYDMNIDDSCKYRHEASKSLAKDIWVHQQAKIDELQARIDEALNMLNSSDGYGYIQCTRLATNILKGDKYE